MSYKPRSFHRDVRLLINCLQGHASSRFECDETGRICAEPRTSPATLPKYVRDRHHPISITRRFKAEFSADTGSKPVADIEEGVDLEDLGEYPYVLKVDDADFVRRVEEKILLLNVGVIDATSLSERG